MGIAGKVTASGQTTIPEAIRDQLGLVGEAGIEWQIVDGRVSVVARELKLIDLAGVLGNPLGRHSTIEEMDAAVGEGVARHVLGEDGNNRP